MPAGRESNCYRSGKTPLLSGTHLSRVFLTLSAAQELIKWVPDWTFLGGLPARQEEILSIL